MNNSYEVLETIIGILLGHLDLNELHPMAREVDSLTKLSCNLAAVARSQQQGYRERDRSLPTDIWDSGLDPPDS